MAIAATLMLGMSGAAHAATSFFLYSGPGAGYPVVTNVGPAVNVDIYGCDSTWRWCDVSYNGMRGWMPASNLWSTWHRHRSNIVEYGPATGIPVIVFDQRTYWDRHYRDRPFYGRQSYWHGGDRDRDDRRIYWHEDRDATPSGWHDRGWHSNHHIGSYGNE
jgi:uncharacterized protein YraI